MRKGSIAYLSHEWEPKGPNIFIYFLQTIAFKGCFKRDTPFLYRDIVRIIHFSFRKSKYVLLQVNNCTAYSMRKSNVAELSEIFLICVCNLDVRILKMSE
jgi:hypothetical protein